MEDSRLPDEKPPILGSWNRMYALVIITLALSIIALAFISR